MCAETHLAGVVGGHPDVSGLQFLILRQGERQDYAAINERDRMQTAPAKNAACAPVNLIAQDIGDRDPKQTGNNQRISEPRY